MVTVSWVRSLGISALLAGVALPAAAQVVRVVDVPATPAFVRPAGQREQPARVGQRVLPPGQLRTETPGKLQGQLSDGRQFRLGGNAVLRLGSQEPELLRGQIIAWVEPGRKSRTPLRIRTRSAVASIVGTTVFIEESDDKARFFSWEGHVTVTTREGQRFELTSGQELTREGDRWLPPRTLTREEARTRRQKSLLLNGFTAPMQTLPILERELGLTETP